MSILNKTLAVHGRSVATVTAAAVVGVVSLAVMLWWDSPIFAEVRVKNRKQLKKIKGGNLPFIGDIVLILKNFERTHEFMLDSIESTNGETFLFQAPFMPPIFVVSDPKIVEHVLKDKFDVYPKGPIMNAAFKDTLGDGIFNADGENWWKQRKIASHIFSVKNFKSFVSVVFKDEMKTFTTRLEQLAQSQTPFDLQDLFFRFTLNGFCKIGFGTDLHCLESDQPIPFATGFDRTQWQMNPTQQTPTYDQLKKMDYANAVFHESLRLFPSVPREMKQANANDILPDGTQIPKGSLIVWHPYSMGRLESIWGPDAKQFKPERWLKMEKQVSPYDYPVFNAGPRVCLGKSMAELEGVFVLVGLLRGFEITVLEGQNVTYGMSLTLPMRNGLKVLVKARMAA
ncbi:hypothetical protein HDU76_000402 [Blyttiomyces sp. JEL0837]|nr:hypothetical protein HDU76_000402 [Blyttiomyces sp. JEL0837]